MGNNKKKKKAALQKAAPKQVNKKRDLKRHMLIFAQALFGVLIGVCFFLYRTNSEVQVVSNDESSSYIPSLYEISRDYFSSDSYVSNLGYAVDDVIRFVAIREQMETKDGFSPKKIVYVGDFSSRHNREGYSGIDAGYYLEDLIKWGQKASSESYSFYVYNFYSLEEYCDFWNITEEEVEYPEDYNPNSVFFTSFETFTNLYKSCEGKNVEDYVDNLEDYQILSGAVVDSAYDIYSNYVEYQNFCNRLSEENTNIRYYVKLPATFGNSIYTNIEGLPRHISDSRLNETFKNYGQYIIACPGTLSYNTNTPIEYDRVKGNIVDLYGYCFPDETQIWIGIDTSFPVNDYFAMNKAAISDTRRMIPFTISLGVVSLASTLAFTVLIFLHEKKRYLVPEGKELLSDFDRMPFEASLLFFILIVLALFMGEKLILRNFDFFSSDKNSKYIVTLFLIFVDFYVLSSFFFSLVRRLLCDNLFEGSLFDLIRPKIERHTKRIRRWFWHVYDSSGVALRTWSGYVVFLIINVFFALLMFFGEHPIPAFIILFIFDAGVGADLFNKNFERKRIIDGIQKISEGEYEYKIDSLRMHGDNKELADAVNNIGLGLGRAVEISTKDEKLKADLITNVSHDIKTPLTSIINYVDLLKRINIDDERAKKYINVLDEKSQRLKQLTFDLVEASKITSGNISIDLIKIDFVEFLKQTIGEFEDKFHDKNLSIIVNVPDTPVNIMADPRHMWRVIENLFNNVCKYALSDTRVYVDLVTISEKETKEMVLSVKNISEQKLNIAADELTERFIRGDVSRSTEGSGLGLSIAKSLTTAQKGNFEIYLDGDLFKVTLTFDLC